MTKRKFQLYLNDCEVVAKILTEKQIGRLFKAIVAYLKGEPTDKLLDTPQVQVAFGMIRGRLDEDTARQERNAQQYRENGAKGGRPRKATTAAARRKTGEAHAETHPIEKATAEQSTQDGQESGETKKTKAVLKKPKRLFENQSGFCPLQEDENQADTKTKAVFNEKLPEIGSVEEEKPIPPTPPLYNTQDNNYSLSSGVRTCEEGEEAIKAIDELEKELLGSQIWIETLCKNRQLTAKEVTTYIMDFCAWLREVGQPETLTEARRHFVNQLPHIIRKYQQTTEQDNNNGNRITNSPRTRRQDERRSRAEGYAAAIASLAAEEGGTA